VRTKARRKKKVVSGELYRIFIGCDVGFSEDYTAISVVEQVIEKSEERAAYERVLMHERGIYTVRHLERMKLPTGPDQIIARLRTILLDQMARNEADVWLLVDRTGVGQPLVHYIRSFLAGEIETVEFAHSVQILGVHITSGFSDRIEGNTLYVPRNDLLSSAKTALGTHNLKVPRRLPFRAEFERELQAFRLDQRLKNPDDPEESLWRTQEHDDLIFAVAMPIWLGGKYVYESYTKRVTPEETYAEWQGVVEDYTPLSRTPIPPMPHPIGLRYS
jgi:hypothetical protein